MHIKKMIVIERKRGSPTAIQLAEYCQNGEVCPFDEDPDCCPFQDRACRSVTVADWKKLLKGQRVELVLSELSVDTPKVKQKIADKKAKLEEQEAAIAAAKKASRRVVKVAKDPVRPVVATPTPAPAHKPPAKKRAAKPTTKPCTRTKRKA